MQTGAARGFAINPNCGEEPGRLGVSNVQEMSCAAVDEAKMILPIHMRFRLEGSGWREVAHNDIRCGDDLICISFRGDTLETLCRMRASKRFVPQGDAIDTLLLDEKPVDLLQK